MKTSRTPRSREGSPIRPLRCAAKFNVRAFAITCGVVRGLGVLVLASWVIVLDGQGGGVTLLSLMLRGFTFLPMGSVIGLLWALPDGSVIGALTASLYNRFGAERSIAS
jgi:hypothetical protein